MKKLSLGALFGTILLSSVLLAGEPVYKIGAFVEAEIASKKLNDAGFTVVTTVQSSPSTQTIVFTSEMMKKMSSEKERGFASVGRLLIDKERNVISIANPIYFNEAFLQSSNNKDKSASLLATLTKQFGQSQASADSLNFGDIAKYHFMMGMPYYEDMIKVGFGSISELLKKAKASSEVKGVVEITPGKYLVLVGLSTRTGAFTKKIGTQNSHVIPYPVLLEDGEAKIMDPKYFIALSYPDLTMSEFMKISTVPDAISNEMKKIFK